MTSEEREKLKKKLSREITETKETIENLEEATQPISPDNAIGRISRMEAINSKSVNEAALDGAVAKLSKLENALSRIDREDFGLCSKCKEPIQFARLLFMPESDRCVACARR